MNGRIRGDEKCDYTWMANQGASIVDYNIASSEIFENISLFHVEDRDESVHFPLKCIISLRERIEQPTHEIDLDDHIHVCQQRTKYRWDQLRSDTFMTKFRQPKFSVLYDYAC